MGWCIILQCDECYRWVRGIDSVAVRNEARNEGWIKLDKYRWQCPNHAKQETGNERASLGRR